MTPLESDFEQEGDRPREKLFPGGLRNRCGVAAGACSHLSKIYGIIRAMKPNVEDCPRRIEERLVLFGEKI